MKICTVNLFWTMALLLVAFTFSSENNDIFIPRSDVKDSSQVVTIEFRTIKTFTRDQYIKLRRAIIEALNKRRNETTTTLQTTTIPPSTSIMDDDATMVSTSIITTEKTGAKEMTTVDIATTTKTTTIGETSVETESITSAMTTEMTTVIPTTTEAETTTTKSITTTMTITEPTTTTAEPTTTTMEPTTTTEPITTTLTTTTTILRPSKVPESKRKRRHAIEDYDNDDVGFVSLPFLHENETLRVPVFLDKKKGSKPQEGILIDTIKTLNESGNLQTEILYVAVNIYEGLPTMPAPFLDADSRVWLPILIVFATMLFLILLTTIYCYWIPTRKTYVVQERRDFETGRENPLTDGEITKDEGPTVTRISNGHMLYPSTNGHQPKILDDNCGWLIPLWEFYQVDSQSSSPNDYDKFSNL